MNRGTDFAHAMAALLQGGGRIRRMGWPIGDHVVLIDEPLRIVALFQRPAWAFNPPSDSSGLRTAALGGGRSIVRVSSDRATHWMPSQDDMLARDWGWEDSP